jgi:glycosyltransferase involved in cell wall biosynthesis
MPPLVVGVDASRNRSGGAKAHLIGILSGADPREYGIAEVHVWAYGSLLDALPESQWLIKHSPDELKGSLLRQLWWQFRRLPEEVRDAGCAILLNTDAGTVCRFRPSVVISQDMLSYEPGEIERYGVSRMRARLIALKYVQAWSMRHAEGVIFLSQHAARVIQKTTGRLRRVAVIPHGVGNAFREVVRRPWKTMERNSTVRGVYVSAADLYKHQWNVVRAIGDLRKRGYDIMLSLVGGGEGPAQVRLEAEIRITDPRGEFVEQHAFVAQSALPEIFSRSDLFIFASSCENMPNTLVEGMASGLPIACSDRGPMPEVLGSGGVYFDPEDPASISAAIERLLRDDALRESVTVRATTLSNSYSWERCASETWAFLRDTYQLAESSSVTDVEIADRPPAGL